MKHIHEAMDKPKRDSNKTRRGKTVFQMPLSAEEEQMFSRIQEGWNLPTKAETFRWLLKDAHERTVFREHETILGMFEKVVNSLQQFKADQTASNAGVLSDLKQAVGRTSNVADRVAMATETAMEKMASRVENSIAITRKMELDLKEQNAAILKMITAILVRIKVEQVFLEDQEKEAIKEGLNRMGLLGV